MKQKNTASTLFSLAGLLLAVGFFLTQSWSFLILALMAVIMGLLSAGKYRNTQKPADSADGTAASKPVIKRKIGCAVPAFIGTAVFLFLTPPLSIRSTSEMQYPFENRFLSLYRYGEPEWFPDFMPDVQSDYYFEFMPSILQGTGFYTVRFVTTPERAAEYAAEFAEKAVESVPLHACDQDEYALHVDINGEFFGDLPDESVTVYILKNNRNRNHPKSSSVTVDPVSGKIDLTQYG
jgi:hypothetical protein